MTRFIAFLAALCAALAPLPSWAAITAPVQRGASANTTTTSLSVTTTALAANDLIYYQCRTGGTSTLIGVSLNGGANDIGNFTATRTANGVYALEVGYRILPSGLAAGTVAFTFDVTANAQCIVYGVTGVDTTTPASATNAGTGTGNPTLSVTPIAASDMVFVSVYARNSGSYTSDTGGAGFTQLAESNHSIGHQYAGYKLNAGAAPITYSATLGGASEWMEKMTAFKKAGGAAKPCRALLLGVC